MAPLARSILVTGSNRGIGLELIQQLVEMADPPEHIFATCRTPAGPQGKTLNDLARKHSNIHIIQLEVEDQSSVKAAALAVESLLHGKGLNLLINNAGVNSYATLETVEQQEMLSAFNTNVVGPILVVQAFLPLLKKAAREADTKEMSCQRAAIINITSKLASIARGFEVMKGPMYPYRASKAALNMVTACFALELKEEGILCTLMHPGWVKTDMGTEQAPVTVQDSVRGIFNVLANLSLASNGAFLDWEGNTLPCSYLTIHLAMVRTYDGAEKSDLRPVLTLTTVAESHSHVITIFNLPSQLLASKINEELHDSLNYLYDSLNNHCKKGGKIILDSLNDCIA